MFFRFIALVVCLAGFVISALVAFSEPGWQNLQLDMKVIVGLIAAVTFAIMVILVLVSDEKVSAAQKREMHRQRFS